MEGHSAGLCLMMAAHTHALLHGAVLLEEAETQTDSATIINTQMVTNTWRNASTQAAVGLTTSNYIVMTV